MSETTFQPQNPDFETMVKEAFDAQHAMALLGASLTSVTPGGTEIHLTMHDEVMSQYPGILHGGVVGMMADSAMGFAALSLVPAGGAGVTIEYKVNMLRPAAGERFVAQGHVVKAGRQIIVAMAEIYAHADGTSPPKLVATSLGTFLPTLPT
jgi:uncharacterized protein (TIGR00369 family)